jgi:hypothetical protein
MRPSARDTAMTNELAAKLTDAATRRPRARAAAPCPECARREPLVRRALEDLRELRALLATQSPDPGPVRPEEETPR